MHVQEAVITLLQTSRVCLHVLGTHRESAEHAVQSDIHKCGTLSAMYEHAYICTCTRQSNVPYTRPWSTVKPG